MEQRAVCIAALFVMVIGATAWGSETAPVSTVLAAPEAAVSIMRDDFAGTSLSVKAGGFAVTEVSSNGATYERSFIGGEATIAEPGWPDLPTVTRMVRVPPISGIRLQVNRITSRVETGHQPFIAPAQDGSVDLDRPGEPAAEFLAHQGYWPSEPIEIGESVIIRGVRIVPVTIYPMQYNPATGETKFNDEVDFELVYGGVGENIVLNPDRPRPSQTFQPIYESLLVNPPPRRDNYDQPQRGSLLIIYSDANGVDDAVAPLIEWRARQGWDVHTSEVDNGENTNTVKGIIQDAYDDWDDPPEFVTLVGDADGTVAIGTYNTAECGSDLAYVQLEGNDILADAHIGRISVTSVSMLEDVVAKLVNYEADPYMEDTTWYQAGMVCAGNYISGLSTILLNRWVARELTDRGIDDIHEWYYDAPYNNQSVPTFFDSEFERGVAFANYRGWIGLEGTSYYTIMQFREHQMYPVSVTLTCGSGNWAGIDGQNEAFLRSQGGAICGVGLCTSSTHVQYNNAVSAGIWVGLLKQGHYLLGPSINYGRYELYRQYRGHDDGSVTNFSNWTAFMGDPVTHIWTGVPQEITVNHEETLPLGSSGVTVEVLDADEAPLSHALVCLYKADDEFQKVAYTDGDGKVTFDFAPDALSGGDLMVTVTSHNVKPYLGTIAVAEAEYYLGAASWDVNDGEDGTPNPGEDIDLTVHLKNFGTAVPDGEITVTATSLSAWAEVTSDPVVVDAAPAAGQEVEIPVELALDGSAPHGEVVLIGLESSNGQNDWSSVAALEVVAPKLQIAELQFAGGAFAPGDIVDFNVRVANIGGKRIEPFNAHLRGINPVISFPTADAEYGDLDVNQSDWVDGSQFRIRAHPLTIPGMMVTIEMSVESEAGFRDTTTYSFRVSRAGAGTPFGPDKYGYVCFDSGDESWEVAPVYDWVEIDPEVPGYEFEGTNTNLRDTFEDDDKSVAVDLPFDFQYYSRDFNKLTICTNGWAAFGNWVKLADFRNRRIASGDGPNAQLAVFWDNLMTSNDSNILTYYDEDGGRFIVEWSQMQRLWGGNRHPETFELILYEAWAEPTYTGDGVIIYQYKTIENVEGSDVGNADTPYATVGIGNLDDTDGLEYTYWHSYSAGAKPLEDSLAIKFTSATQFITGVLTGTVTDAATGLPMEGVQVYTTRGFWGETDANGVYAVSDILIGEGYVATAHKQGYNDSTKAGDDARGYTILEAETTVVDFNLLHPEFTLDTTEFAFLIPPDSTVETGITLTNGGNGPLTYTSKFVYVLEGQQGVRELPDRGGGPLRRVERDDADDIWNRLLMWNASAATGDNKLLGVAYANEHWLVSGNGERPGEDEDHPFYLFDRWGNLDGQAVQPRAGRFGIKDMDYWEGDVYCATGANYLLRFNPESYEVTGEWSTQGDLRVTETLAVSADGHLFASTVVGDIYEYEVQDESTMVRVQSFEPVDPRDGGSIYKYGLGWFRDDPDYCPLYLMGKRSTSDPDVELYKINPETEEVIWLTDLDLPDAQFSCKGFTITPKWNNLVWVLTAVLDHPDGDQIAVVELGPNSSWIDYTPREGTLQTGESQFIGMTISTADLDTGMYGVVIEFTHNADDGVERVPVDLEVGYPRSASDESAAVFDYALEPNHPNPFNPTTVIGYRLKESGLTRLKLFDMQGREVAVLQNGWRAAGSYRATLDASKLPAGVYIYRLESGAFKATRKMVLVK